MNLEYRSIEGFPLYRVGNDGSVWSIASGDWKRKMQTPDKEGYLQVSLYCDGKAKCAKVHRLVLIAFVGPATDGMSAAHNNGNQADNRIANLRWSTLSDNHRDKWRHGTALCGEKCKWTKLTHRDMELIKEARLSGRTLRSVGREFGISESSVHRIVSGTQRTMK